jgi:hypothetical protein
LPKKSKTISRLSVSIKEPEDVIRHLAKGVMHWKGGYSAHSLAVLWFAENDFPSRVRKLLDESQAFRDAQLLDGFFERQTELGDRERPSQTDLLVIAKTGKGLAVIGVEGKAEESFGELVSEWLAKDANRAARDARLEMLCRMLGFAAADGNLRYQLFHRAAACLIEAERYGADTALLLVHSFSTKQSSLADYKAFVRALHLDDEVLPSAIAGPATGHVNGKKIALYFGWVTDRADHEDFWPRLREHADRSEIYAKTISDWITKRA